MSRVKSRFLLLSLVILVLDQWSKWWIEQTLPYPSSKSIIPGLLNLTHIRNTGVAFGLLPAHGELTGTLMLAGMGLVALGVVGYYFRRTPDNDLFLLTALSLILGGAVGNLIDRLAAGAVTDFVDVYVGVHHWPAFNVADSAISVGIVFLVLDSLRTISRERTAQEPA
jgi:signal peptidase II